MKMFKLFAWSIPMRKINISTLLIVIGILNTFPSLADRIELKTNDHQEARIFYQGFYDCEVAIASKKINSVSWSDGLRFAEQNSPYKKGTDQWEIYYSGVTSAIYAIDACASINFIFFNPKY